MQTEIFEYIKSQRVGVIAVEMPNGSPHAATVHFAQEENPLTFIFQTSPNYRKSQALLRKNSVRASLVIGLVEVEGGKEKTFQLDGEARLVQPNEKHFIESYFDKFTEKREKTQFSDDIFFVFTPTWWRFTDWAKPEGKTVHNSDGTTTIKGKLV